MKNRRPTITVGIPAHSSGVSLVRTIQSIRASKGVYIDEFIVISDGSQLPESVVREAKKLNVRLIRNNSTGSQMIKLKQLVNMLSTDIFVFTQDDILFKNDTIAKIQKTFVNDPKLTMVSVNVYPLPGKFLFEKVMGVGVKILNGIALAWNNSDNYLAASGRCLAFRSSYVKQFHFPLDIVNGDAFLYAENRRLGGAFRLVKEAYIFIRCPGALREQMRPSKRFQYSQKELNSYFGEDLKHMYQIPKKVLFTAFARQFLKSPFLSVLYCGVFLYTKVSKPYSDVKETVWDVELSTKAIS